MRMPAIETSLMRTGRIRSSSWPGSGRGDGVSSHNCGGLGSPLLTPQTQRLMLPGPSHFQGTLSGVFDSGPVTVPGPTGETGTRRADDREPVHHLPDERTCRDDQE